MLAAVAALFAAIGLAVLRPVSPALESHAAFDQPASEVAANAAGIDAVSVPARANYKYSVIPGGAANAEELARAIQADEVVADHYRDVDPSTMHPQTVSVGRMAHVSYRIDDRVYWTKKPVRIYEGETILTDGETEIRARCGNAISMSPLLPTSDDEPESTELDALTNAGPKLLAFDLAAAVPSAMPTIGDEGGDSLVLAPPLPFDFYPSYAPRANNVGAVEANGGIPLDGPQDTATALSSRCTPASGFNAPIVNLYGERSGTLAEGDPCAVDPAELDFSDLGPSLFSAPLFNAPLFNASLFSASGFNPSEPDPSEDDGPLVLQPLLGPETDPGSFAATDLTPVPEPATLVLLGSGIAGLIARHRRQSTRPAARPQDPRKPHASRGQRTHRTRPVRARL